MRLEEEVEEQGFDRHRVMADFAIARGERTGEFEPIERRLAGERRAIRAPTFELAHRRRHQRVVASSSCEVFLAERDGGTRCAMSVRTLCSMRSGARPSRKQPANRSATPMAQSVDPKSKPRASEVIAPPSKSAATRRPRPAQTDRNPCYTPSASRSPSFSAQVVQAKQLSLISEPRCTYFGEISGLDLRPLAENGAVRVHRLGLRWQAMR
jgi:hypothetical protein